jgi:plasmid stability protein
VLTLTPERWREVSPHLDHALSLEKEERETWLNTLQSENPELAELLSASGTKSSSGRKLSGSNARNPKR